MRENGLRVPGFAISVAASTPPTVLWNKCACLRQALMRVCVSVFVVLSMTGFALHAVSMHFVLCMSYVYS